MASAKDRILSELQKGFYRNPKSLGEYVKFIEFGSPTCYAEVYDENFAFVTRRAIGTEELSQYEFIPKDNLPQAFRVDKSNLVQAVQQTAQTAQSPRLKSAGEILQNYSARAGNVQSHTPKREYPPGPRGNVYVYG